MATLHTINKSPFTHTELKSCLGICRPGDAILLIEDAVYAIKAGSVWNQHLSEAADSGIKLYALKNDVLARGIIFETGFSIETVDYSGFVQLACVHERTQSWY